MKRISFSLMCRFLLVGLMLLSGGLTCSMSGSANAAARETAAERWRSIGPAGGTLNAVHRTANSVFLAGTQGGGIYRASALDSPWTHVESYTPASTLNETLIVYSFASNASAIFAVTNRGVFRSTDGGIAWQLLENLKRIGEASEVAANDGVIVATMYGQGVFRSLNGGLDWVAANNGLTVSTFTTVGNAGSTFFAAGNNGRVYRSTDNAQNWVLVGAGLPPSPRINDFEIVTSPESLVFIASDDGIFRSSDNGVTFNDFSRGLRSRTVNEISYTGADLFAATGDGVFYSTDRGLSWLERNTGIGSRFVSSVTVAASGKNMAGTDGGVFITSNAGESWRPHNVNLFAQAVSQLYPLTNGTMLAGMNYFSGGILRSNDGGATWETTSGAPGEANCFLQIGTKALAGTSNSGLYISSDSGANWALRNRPLPATNALAASGTNIFAATSEGVFRSADEGGVWTRASTGLPGSGYASALLALSDDRLYAGTRNGVYLSSNQGGSWTALNNGLAELDVTSFLYIGSTLYAGTTNGVFRFNGVSAWLPASSGLPGAPNRRVRTLRGLGRGLVFAGLPNGVYYTLDDGETWWPYSDGMTHPDVQTLTLAGGSLLAGTYGSSVFSISLNDFACRFSITPTSRTHTAAAASDTVSVTDAVACGWSATSRLLQPNSFRFNRWVHRPPRRVSSHELDSHH